MPDPIPASSPVGLPDGMRACLFDLDGVLTDTAEIHAAAWKEMFDAYLKARALQTGTPYICFDAGPDYDTYVDGKSRADGTRSFLQSRGIDLPDDRAGASVSGAASISSAASITALGDAKNAILMKRIRRDGVRPYPGSVRYVRAVRSAGFLTAVVSSSANCAEVLRAAGLADLFQARVDGVVSEELHLAGKPAPDTFLAASKLLGVEPDSAAVFEDALAGVAAGRAGGFGYVVGVDRVGQADQLRSRGADRVVTDLAQMLELPAPSNKVDPS